jgi:hypothetical protein
MNEERKIGKICRRSGKIYPHSWKKKPEPEMPTRLLTRHADATKAAMDAGLDRYGMALIGAARALDDNRHCGTENASLLNRLQLITKDHGPC